ncbi:MAG: glycerate kinase [Limnochordia bacterium]|jgi:glycerate kinase
MRILVAIDSFKGSVDASEAAEALSIGLKRALPDSTIELVPMADGGEGTVRSLVDATGGRIITKEVCGPLGEPVEAFYGILGDGDTAVIEMAAASGLPLIRRDQRNPRLTTSYGTGELIRSALDEGCRRFIIGIGGSATNDGGAGMVQALGAQLLDKEGQQIGPGGASLFALERIDVSQLDPRIKESRFLVASDVDNPLLGDKGATAVYGPQKGATPEMIKELDQALAHYAKIIKRDLGTDVANIPGSGAAGGLGAGAIAFFGATLRPGVELVVEAVGLEEKVKEADFVVTGEGAVDAQTVHGKTPIGVARVAKMHGKPVIAVAGNLGKGAEAVYDHGVDALLSIAPGPISLEEAMDRAVEFLEKTGERLGRLIRIGCSVNGQL